MREPGGFSKEIQIKKMRLNKMNLLHEENNYC